MKKTLETEMIEFKILQPILTIFILFFTLAIFTIIYLESLSFEDSDYKILIYTLVTLGFSSALFYIIKNYIRRFNDKVKNIHNTNIKSMEFSSKYLKALEDSSPNFIISATNGKIEKVNKSFLDFNKYKDLSSFHLEHKCVSELFV